MGDFIELDSGLRGVVKEINTRATVITTNDGVDLVVPNSVLVTTQLTNWTLRESYGRMRVTFGVAYGTDKDLVKNVALEAISRIDCALTHMPGLEPQVRLSNLAIAHWSSRFCSGSAGRVCDGQGGPGRISYGNSKHFSMRTVSRSHSRKEMSMSKVTTADFQT